MQQQGYGYGYQQGGDYYQQQAQYQQQQWGYQQQGYPQQQQQQWGYQQQPQAQYYDPYQQQQQQQQQQVQQPQYYDQQPQQQQPRAQQPRAQQFDDDSDRRGGKGFDNKGADRGGKGYGGGGGKAGGGGDKGAGGKGGAAGGKGGAGGGGGGKGRSGGASEMTYEEYKAAQAAKKQQQAQAKQSGGGGGGGQTLEEYQAAQAAKKAQKAAAGPSAAAPPRIQERGTKLEEAPAAEPKAAKEPAPAPPAAKEEPPAQEDGAADDWEAEADAPAESAAPPAAEPEPAKPPPAKEPEPKAPEPKEEKKEKPAPKEEVKAPEPEAAEEEEEEPEAVEAVAVEAATQDTGKKQLAAPDPRPHLNVVFIGHVDAGKSTTCGNVLYLCGCVDDRTVEKYMKEAKDKNRESWFLAYIMDTNEEEKAKGKTVEVGRAHFETENRRWTILDAPGHKSYVPNMIGGASQADMGVLIISARKGEFETGFERGGQTREHALLAKTLGVDKLVVAVNKMDDMSVEWAQERYDEITKKLGPFLKQSGFKDDQVIFLPISGLTGDNIKERKSTPSWFTGKTLLDLLDSLEVPKRNPEMSLRIPMLDGFRDMGAIMAIGKVEQGTVKPGQKVVVMPTGHKCTVTSVFVNEVEMQYASCGENVTMKMAGVTEDQLLRGFVMSAQIEPVRVVTKFKAQLQVIELPEERPVMTSGYKAIVHVHVAIEECEILKLYEAMSMTDRKKKEKNPRFVRENSILTCSIQLARPTPVDVFTGVQQLGRFTMRDEGRTIAIGKITELPKA